ncbi:hypothetical protein SANTM175S_00631 [Streptomyces antimycoticus]
MRAHADELRKYGAVVFGRTVGPGERDAVRDAFAAARSDAVCVTALAPIVPLLVAQVEQALDRTPHDRRRLLGLTAVAGGAEAVVEVASACRVSWRPTASTGCPGPMRTNSSTPSWPRAPTASPWTPAPSAAGPS